MSLPRYLVIDVFKATAMVIVLALHTFVLSGLQTERNGALLATGSEDYTAKLWVVDQEASGIPPPTPAPT